VLLCTRNKDTHKVMFGIVAVDCNDILTLNTPSKPPGHAYKLHVYKPQCTSGMRSNFFRNRVTNIRNSSMPTSVHFASLISFKRSLKCVDLSAYLIEQ